MCLGTRHHVLIMENIQVKYRGFAVEKVQSYKYLGVQIDSHLNFNENTEYITKKMVSRIGLLGKTRKIVSQETCLYLYKQLLLPRLDYSDYIYDGTSQKNAFTLQKLQNNAARRILRADFCTPGVLLHQERRIDRLHIMRFKHLCEMTYKILNDLAPSHLKLY